MDECDFIDAFLFCFFLIFELVFQAAQVAVDLQQ